MMTPSRKNGQKNPLYSLAALAERDHSVVEVINRAAAQLPDGERRQLYAALLTPPDPDAPTPEPSQEAPVLLTDMGNARRFARQHRGRVAYVKAWGWLVWDGHVWYRDETGQVMQLAKQTAHELYGQAGQELNKAKDQIDEIEAAQAQGDSDRLKAAKTAKSAAERKSKEWLAWAIKSQSAPRLAAMLQLAQDEPECVSTPDSFDTSPMLFNVENGVIDLQTGVLLPHKPDLKMTQLSPVVYDPQATCPTWHAFLERIFDHNDELIEFIRRAVGYSLTGVISEQCLFFLHGKGRNGKSTFISALSGILGSYGKRTPSDTLMLKQVGGVTNDLARLAGARLVVAAELAEGRRLNENLVKDMTGGDKITARYLFHESFEFYPQYHLWMYGNHKPTITGTDEGIWRRIRLIPFDVTIPEGEVDKELPHKLEIEYPGILAWAVQGCLEWQRSGLPAPEAVARATREYREEMDILGAFIAERCIRLSTAQVTKIALYNAYAEWCKAGGLNALPEFVFKRKLKEDLGLVPDGREGGTGRALYQGIGLLADEDRERQVEML